MPNIIINPNQISKVKSQLDFILLDGSSSMKSKWWPMLGAIDTYIAQLRREAVDSTIRLDVFDSHDLQLTTRNTHISSWVTFDVEPIGSHWGSTPLYDAIVIMGRNIRDLNPTAGCAITIVTDGEEVGSTFADVVQARSVLDYLRALGYSVTFIGCDFNNSRQSRALGANESNAIGVQTKLLGEAATSLAKKRAHHARTGDGISFTDDEKQQFGGYLSHSGAK